jgi:hypothetical protein
MDVIEVPIERLNYFNGQRLAADDFRLEQAYHMRVRRWLNRALYSPGIAMGLEVTVKDGDPHTVVVAPGLALDDLGRELILIEPREIQVTGIPSSVEGVVYGNYLVLQYGEELVAAVEDGCAVRAGGNTCATRELAWGGPMRNRLSPDLHFQDIWPALGSGQVVLAQVELTASCAVRRVNLGVRRYANPTQSGRTQPYALEGEKDLDGDNPKLLYFHIRGGRPDTVTLYLRAAAFTSMYYTELGRHTHTLAVSLATAGAVASHSHTLDELTSSESGAHTHTVTANADDPDEDHNALEMHGADQIGLDITERANVRLSESGAHSHTIAAGQATSTSPGTPAHIHAVTATAGNTGMVPSARLGTSYSFVENMQVFIDGQEFTQAILDRLGWGELGDGTSGHPLATDGTGPVQLELLGADLNEGEHVLELRVPAGEGGRIIYNLYVE